VALQKLTELDWFRDQYDEEELKAFESNFRSSARTQEALLAYLDHELERLDNNLSFTKLKNVPDRAEVALMGAAQKDVLKQVKQLLLED